MGFASKDLSCFAGARSSLDTPPLFFGSILEENGSHPCNSSRTFIRKLYTNAD